MDSGICVLMEQYGLSIPQLPHMREWRLKALTRGLVSAAVFAERDDSGTICYELVCDGGETIPLAAELHEDVRQNGIRPNRDTAIWTALSLGSLNSG